MKIEELKNRIVKTSDRSITCKDENGKTAGIVTGAERFKTLQPNKAINYFKQIKDAGLWGSGETDRVYIQNNKIYYLFDLRPIEFYKKHCEGREGWETETENYNKRLQRAEEAAKVATVIPCYIIN